MKLIEFKQDKYTTIIIDLEKIKKIKIGKIKENVFGYVWDFIEFDEERYIFDNKNEFEFVLKSINKKLDLEKIEKEKEMFDFSKRLENIRKQRKEREKNK